MKPSTSTQRRIMRQRIGMKFDRKYGYVTNVPDLDPCKLHRVLHDHRLRLNYIDGCFKPYLVER